MTTKNRAAVTLGKKGGKVRSEAKAAAARANGRKGGRPRVLRCPRCGRREDAPNFAYHVCSAS